MSKPTLQQRLREVWDSAKPMLNDQYPNCELVFNAITPVAWERDTLTLTLTTDNRTAYNVLSHPSFRGMGDILMVLMKQERRVVVNVVMAERRAG
jgi:hypothetical protein